MLLTAPKGRTHITVSPSQASPLLLEGFVVYALACQATTLKRTQRTYLSFGARACFVELRKKAKSSSNARLFGDSGSPAKRSLRYTSNCANSCISEGFNLALQEFVPKFVARKAISLICHSEERGISLFCRPEIPRSSE